MLELELMWLRAIYVSQFLSGDGSACVLMWIKCKDNGMFHWILRAEVKVFSAEIAKKTGILSFFLSSHGAKNYICALLSVFATLS